MNEDETRVVAFLRSVAERYRRDAEAWEQHARAKNSEAEEPGYRWKYGEALTVDRMAMLIEGGEHRREQKP